jgi:predicted ester cyclase
VIWSAWAPGLAQYRGYQRDWLRGDVVAGLTVAAYLVPQVMAYATVAGLPPVVGLWAAHDVDEHANHHHAGRTGAYRRPISGGGTMSIEDNKNLVRRFYREIDAGNVDALDELVAEDYLDHSPPPFPGIDAPGREGLKQAFRLFWDATPGTHEIEDQIAEGDKVVTRLTARGTHRGDLPGIPTTGNEMCMTATVIHRIANGRLAEKWSDKDVLAMLQQLNVIPPLS